jgi:hypothetical protein
MTKAELYRRQGEQAARAITRWPRWMRANIVTSSEEYWAAPSVAWREQEDQA